MPARQLPPGYTLGPAALAEIAALQAIDRRASDLFASTGLILPEFLGETVPGDVLAEAITAGNLIAARTPSGDLAGFAFASPRNGTLYLDQVSVDPAEGRKGLGSALVRAVIARARTLGLASVTLSTFRDLPWNGPFYRRFGFRELPRKRLAGWMREIEAAQAGRMDVTARCFMQRRVRLL